MAVFLDTIFFIIFTLTSLLWVVPVLGIFFIPFLITRLIKGRAKTLAKKTGLKRVYHFPKGFKPCDDFLFNFWRQNHFSSLL